VYWTAAGFPAGIGSAAATAVGRKRATMAAIRIECLVLGAFIGSERGETGSLWLSVSSDLPS
jgi:hypothetical protein